MNTYLKDNNYLYIPNFISKGKAFNLAKSFEEFAEKEGLSGDEQAPHSKSCYNFVDFTELLCNKVNTVTRILGENVFPTYCYARVYGKGDDLKIHSDRDACEISLTINLFQENPWPIYIKRPDGSSAKIVLSPGDAMMYLGCEADHWRDTLEDDKHVQLFLHYVKSRGPRASSVFDSRIPVPHAKLNYHLPSIEGGKYFSKLEEYILYREDMVPMDLVKDILKEYRDDTGWQQSRVGGNGGVIDTSIRGASSIGMSLNEVIEVNPEKRRELDSRLFECVARAIQLYASTHKECVIQQDTGYDLLKYEAGYGYSQHIDNFMDFPRSVSCSIALNDDYEGGEFTFFDKKISIKQKAGSVVMFPSSFQYPHAVEKVVSGTRYSIITWFM